MGMRRLVSGAAVLGLTGTFASAVATLSGAAAAAPSGGCTLAAPGNPIKHVIYLQFDNVHLSRDNPNVPSDLEQMPKLLDFLRTNGTLDDNHHTPLIAHTGTDILTSLTGMYGSNMGQPVSNSYRYYKPDGTSSSGATFAYWTDGIYDPSAKTAPTDHAPTMVTQDGKIAPAPWVAYTKAGCDFGAVGTANSVLESPDSDLKQVFGSGSPEVAEGKADADRAATDFVGIGVHCAKNSRICATGHARPDLLPDEPGGYDGYQGLFGTKYVDPAISTGGPVTAISGRTITDAKGNPGFPGFDGLSADNSLGYLAQMQESGIPVTFGYISDAHDRHPNGNAYGPGEAGYVQTLKSYDIAFGKFFERLKRAGITPANTLLVVTSDENDHFAGGPPSPANCDGIQTPCAYPKIGEINVNATGLLATQQHTKTPFALHADSAPNFYLNGNPKRDDATTRAFERAVSKLTAVNPITGTTDKVVKWFADPVEMSLLHMVSGDPLRTPTFTAFADPNYFVRAGRPTCKAACVAVAANHAWNHGDFAGDINRTWLGIVAPGVKRLGTTSDIWSDHADIRPTMLSLLGLSDPYGHDGRTLFELMTNPPAGLQGESVQSMAATFKQLNAAVGLFGAATLADSTDGIVSNSPGDTTYATAEARLERLGQTRDQIAGHMLGLLEQAEFRGGDVDQSEAKRLDEAGEALIWLAQHPDAPLNLPKI